MYIENLLKYNIFNGSPQLLGSFRYKPIFFLISQRFGIQAYIRNENVKKILNDFEGNQLLKP